MSDIPDEILRAFADASNVDIQLYMGRLLERLRQTATGGAIAEWSERNPVLFQGMLRAIAVAAQRYPRGQGVLSDTIREQVSRLPVEILRAIDSGGSPALRGGDSAYEPADEDFRRRFEAALDGLSDQEVSFMAHLDRPRIREFVNSPARMRPHLLSKWKSEKGIAEVVDDAAGSLVGPLKQFTKLLKERRLKRLAERSLESQ